MNVFGEDDNGVKKSSFVPGRGSRRLPGVCLRLLLVYHEVPKRKVKVIDLVRMRTVRERIQEVVIL